MILKFILKFAKIIKDLQESRENCEVCKNENRKLGKDYTKAMHQIDQQSIKIGEIEQKALDLEEENSRVLKLCINYIILIF